MNIYRHLVYIEYIKAVVNMYANECECAQHKNLEIFNFKLNSRAQTYIHTYLYYFHR